MIEIDATDGGFILSVQVQPGARRNAIVGVHAGRLKLTVTKAPKKGKANQAIVELLAAALNLAKSQITILSGQASRRKRIRVGGLSAEEIQARLAGQLPTN